MKNILDKSRAFTLIEVLVVITIITILAVSGWGLNYQRLGDSEHVKILQNNIKNQLEEARNLALLGKGIEDGSELVNPELWSVGISKHSNDYLIKTLYKPETTGTMFDYKSTNLRGAEQESLSIRCGSGGPLGDNEVIVFNGNDIDFLRCGNEVLNIIIKYKNIEKNIYFDPVSGVISQD